MEASVIFSKCFVDLFYLSVITVASSDIILSYFAATVSPVDTRRTLTVHKTFRRRPGRFSKSFSKDLSFFDSNAQLRLRFSIETCNLAKSKYEKLVFCFAFA